jgi:hypothetical protein
LKEIEDSVLAAQKIKVSAQDMKHPTFYKPLIISFGLMLFQ